MAFIEVKGGRLHYQLDGPEGAPVIVLSNSLGTNMAMWEPQMALLTRQFRVLRYDTRGHGLSSVTPGPYTIAGLGRDVTGLLDSLVIERAHFCGLSMGGMIGQWLGIHARHRLDRLVLCNTAARISTVDAWNTRISMVRQGGMEAIVSAILQRWFTTDFIERAPSAIESMRQMLLGTSAQGYVACCEALRDADLIADATRTKARTLVIAGAHDPATPPEQGRFLAARISGAGYLELPASHLSNIEAAEAFTAALVDFLSQPEAQ
jgi:3-oxoadipate enol-lactonase